MNQVEDTPRLILIHGWNASRMGCGGRCTRGGSGAGRGTAHECGGSTRETRPASAAGRTFFSRTASSTELRATAFSVLPSPPPQTSFNPWPIGSGPTGGESGGLAWTRAMVPYAAELTPPDERCPVVEAPQTLVRYALNFSWAVALQHKSYSSGVHLHQTLGHGRGRRDLRAAGCWAGNDRPASGLQHAHGPVASAPDDRAVAAHGS